MGISRRGLLGAGLAGAALPLASSPMAFFDQKSGRRPKNIIFCVVDGMALSMLTMADHFTYLSEGKRSYWANLLNDEDVTIGWQDTRSLNSLVTDSAAASASWGSGRHIWNGQLNEYPDGTKLRTLVSLMVEAGVKCGLVTTTTITHATPAGFTVNCVQRDLEHLIAEEYLKSGVDVLMGGGNRSFNPAMRRDKRDLYADFAKAGYEVVRDRNALMSSKNKKVLGIFANSHLPFSVDRENDPAEMAKSPSLSEMAKIAIDKLKGSRNGFLLQIEGGKVDHGAHANDLAGALYDQIEFERTLKVVVDFARQDKDTLVIITADHACGGPALNGAGDEYSDATPGLLTVKGMKSSYSPMVAKFDGTAKRVQEIAEASLGLKLTSAEADAIVAATKGNSPFKLAQFHGGSGQTLAMILGNHTKVTWTSGNHTSDHVIVTALGPGSEVVQGLTQNTSFFDILLATKGLRHSNPRMSYLEAAPAYEKLKERLKGDSQTLAMLRTEDEECFCH